VSSATAGQSFAFTITVSNSSSVAFTNVTISDTVPTDTMTVTSVAGSSGVAATNSGNQVTAAIASLAAGQSATVTVNVTVNKGVKSTTTLTNSASVSATGATTISASVSVPVATGATTLPTTGFGGDPNDTQLYVFGFGAALAVAFVSFVYLMRGRTRRQA
jgi:uncharacterized repeat protein (TIGR01451 family)